jgi:bacterioferritin (cytochrome b1)
MNKQIKTALLIIIAAFLSWTGISKLGKFTQEQSAQQQTLAQVQQLVTEADNVNNNLDLNSLKSNQTKLQQAITTLEKIPNLPGLPYQKAQKDLAELRPRLLTIESKLKIEEQALASLQSALKLDDEAAAFVKNQSFSQKNWQESKNKWEQAINLLQNIPANTFVSDAAKQGLAACQRNYTDVSKGLEFENQSVQSFNSAIEASQKAVQITANSPYTLPDLLNAKSQWQLAINLLTNLPSGTVVSTQAESQLIEYRKNYRTVSDAIDQIEKCKADNLSFETSCTDNISLEITPIQTALNNNTEPETSETSEAETTDYSNSDNTASDSNSSYSSSIGSYSRSGSGSVYVHPYTRSNGTHVQGHYRSSPGTRVGGFGSFRSGGAHS